VYGLPFKDWVVCSKISRWPLATFMGPLWATRCSGEHGSSYSLSAAFKDHLVVSLLVWQSGVNACFRNPVA
jgi:hypothetical protein